MTDKNDDDGDLTKLLQIVEVYSDDGIGDTISRRFKEGIEALDYTIEEISHWKYCGGCHDQEYWRLLWPSREFPPYSTKCACDQVIKYNCWITPDKNDPNGDIITLGRCCIRRFIPCHKKTCRDCGGGHRSTMVDYCSKCIKKHKIEATRNLKAAKKAALEKKQMQEKRDKILSETGCEKCVIAIIDNGYKRCFNCNKKKYNKAQEPPQKDTCQKCVEAVKKGYKKCYPCNERIKKAINCDVCCGTGISYWSDDIYGECLECQ
jgi:hypothetical protein